ncbi:MAG TPA: PilZ domain-containing protein, partial [Burkholderiaceae bacterium]|nr:PilZ domain-containing protein [Burkholderiaceae bacterium]
VTEDAHTALRLHRKGYRSAYLRMPLAAGLATENLAAHVGQRIRWARGMVQIFRMDNPLFGSGLTLAQRLCYLNAMLHFLAGIPRLIYLTAPLAFLLFHAYIIYAPAIAVVLYVLPHMMHAGVTNSRMQGTYRHTFWGEIYETVLSWYIARPTTVALLWPSRGAFNVTAKGGLIEEPYFDWKMATPYVVLAAVNVLGLGFGVWRLGTGPAAEVGTVVLTMVWTLYNLVLLGGAIAVAAETRQVRRSHRVWADFEAGLELADGRVVPGRLTDFSSGGVGMMLSEAPGLDPRERVVVLMEHDGQKHRFPAHVSSCDGVHVGIGVDLVTPQQKIDFLRCTFARGDVWLHSQDGFAPDRPLRSGLGVAKVGISGYRRMLTSLPALFLKLIYGPQTALRWVWSFVPRTPLVRRTGHARELTVSG